MQYFNPGTKPGCQMVYFQTKNPNLGKIHGHLVHFVFKKNLYQEKSGNPGTNLHTLIQYFMPQ
jgi:hypothetical protein